MSVRPIKAVDPKLHNVNVNMNFTKEQWARVKQLAKADGRNVRNYVKVLILADLKNKGRGSI